MEVQLTLWECVVGKWKVQYASKKTLRSRSVSVPFRFTTQKRVEKLAYRSVFFYPVSLRSVPSVLIRFGFRAREMQASLSGSTQTTGPTADTCHYSRPVVIAEIDYKAPARAYSSNVSRQAVALAQRLVALFGIVALLDDPVASQRQLLCALLTSYTFIANWLAHPREYSHALKRSKRTERNGTARNGNKRLKNGNNGKKTGTERNGMERAKKRNGTETERFFDAYCIYMYTYVYTCTCLYSTLAKLYNIIEEEKIDPTHYIGSTNTQIHEQDTWVPSLENWDCGYG